MKSEPKGHPLRHGAMHFWWDASALIIYIQFADSTVYSYQAPLASSWLDITQPIDAGTNIFQFMATFPGAAVWVLIQKEAGPPTVFDDDRPGFGDPTIGGALPPGPDRVLPLHWPPKSSQWPKDSGHVYGPVPP